MTQYLLDVIPNAIWWLLGAFTVYVGTRWRRWRRQRGQGAILAGLEDNTLLVFPPKDNHPTSFIPRMAIEDFLAMNNINGAYLRVGLRPPEKTRDSMNVSARDKKDFNLILICSSKSNRLTAEAIDLLRDKSNHFRALIPYFEAIPDVTTDSGVVPERIRWGNGIYPSPSYTQKGPVYEDMAMIVKVASPWAPHRKLLIVAGIRGIGTWGAGQFLKKWWEELHRRKGQHRRLGITKSGDFAALVRVVYEDRDIKKVELEQVVDLDGPSHL